VKIVLSSAKAPLFSRAGLVVCKSYIILSIVPTLEQGCKTYSFALYWQKKKREEQEEENLQKKKNKERKKEKLTI
jgi:hypothetical protein